MSTAIGRPRATGHYIKRRLRTPSWSWRMAAFAAVLLAATILCFRLGAVDLVALYDLLVACAILAALAALLALGALFRVWQRGDVGGGRAIAALIVSLLVLAPFALLALLAFTNPATNTSMTDAMAAESAAAASPTAADPAADAPSGRRFDAAAPEVYGQIRLVLADEGWAVSDVEVGAPVPVAGEEGASEDGDASANSVPIPIPTPRSSVDMNAPVDPLDQPDSIEYTIRAVALGPVFALPSDVVVHVVQDGEETFVDMLSASRAVRYDFGQNRRFIEDFMSRLDDAMQGVEGTSGD